MANIFNEIVDAHVRSNAATEKPSGSGVPSGSGSTTDGNKKSHDDKSKKKDSATKSSTSESIAQLSNIMESGFQNLASLFHQGFQAMANSQEVYHEDYEETGTGEDVEV